MNRSTQGAQGGNGDLANVERRHVWVSGRVQGVGFRYSCATAAATHSVGGWVRNLPDGRVEAVFEGPAAAVEAMVDWCRTGPRYSSVTRVEAKAEPAQGHTTFAVTG